LQGAFCTLLPPRLPKSHAADRGSCFCIGSVGAAQTCAWLCGAACRRGIRNVCAFLKKLLTKLRALWAHELPLRRPLDPCPVALRPQLFFAQPPFLCHESFFLFLLQTPKRSAAFSHPSTPCLGTSVVEKTCFEPTLAWRSCFYCTCARFPFQLAFFFFGHAAFLPCTSSPFQAPSDALRLPALPPLASGRVLKNKPALSRPWLGGLASPTCAPASPSPLLFSLLPRPFFSLPFPSFPPYCQAALLATPPSVGHPAASLRAGSFWHLAGCLLG
jgi:hypothetical protein